MWGSADITKSLLHDVPTVWLGVGTVAVALFVSLLGLVVVRRVFSVSARERDHEVAGFLIAVVGVIYAVLLGFVVVITWEQFNSTDGTVSDEAYQVGTLYREVAALGPQGLKVRHTVANYAKSVVLHDFHVLGTSQKGSPDTDCRVRQMWTAMTELPSDRGVAAHFESDAIDALVRISDDRRTMEQESKSEIPSPLWVVLIAGGWLTVAFTYFFGLKSFAVQALMVSALATLIALSLFVILTLNLPFTGGVALGPDAMRDAVVSFPTVRFAGAPGQRQDGLTPYVACHDPGRPVARRKHEPGA